MEDGYRGEGGHFFDISLELADVFADDFRIFYFAFLGDLCVRSS